MCKFDKNRAYTSRDIQKALEAEFSRKVALTTISSHLTVHGYLAINGQKQRRYFSGNDCQEVFDHFAKKYANKVNNKQMTINDVEPKKTSSVRNTICKSGILSVKLSEEIRQEVEKRSRIAKISKTDVIEQILLEYFETHPIDIIALMSRDELEAEFKRYQAKYGPL